MADDLEGTYEWCLADGKFRRIREFGSECLFSLLRSAEKRQAFFAAIIALFPRAEIDFTFIYEEYYETLRTLIEAYLLFDGIGAESHQCKNAYLCKKHPDLGVDWIFLEEARLKRNAINYQGMMVTESEWLLSREQFERHIALLRSAIDDLLTRGRP